MEDPKARRPPLVDPDIFNRYREWRWNEVLRQVAEGYHPTGSELANMIPRTRGGPGCPALP